VITRRFATHAHAMTAGLLKRRGAACRTIKHEQRVRFRVAQRPQIGRGDQDKVDRNDGKHLHHPPDGRADASLDASAVPIDLARDQREKPFRVALPNDERTLVAKMLLERREVPDDPVVSKQPVALTERMGVRQRQPPVVACRM